MPGRSHPSPPNPHPDQESDLPSVGAIMLSPQPVALPWRDRLQEHIKQPFWRSLLGVLGVGCAATLGVAGLRGVGELSGSGGMTLGGLEAVELKAYDQMVQWQRHRGPDDRIVVVGLSEQDLETHGWPINDRTLAKTLDTLQQYQPYAIGLDLYRNQERPPGVEELRRSLQADNTIGILELGTGSSNGVPPPPMDPEQVGFNDVVLDADGVVRRFLLLAQKDDTTYFSLAFQVVNLYLSQTHPDRLPTNDPDNPDRITWGASTLYPLSPRSGGYQGEDARGYQLMLQYGNPNQVAPVISLGQVLAHDPAVLEQVRHKIVLIGSVAPSGKDLFFTPYTGSVNRSPYSPRASQPEPLHPQSHTDMYGVMIHAHIVSYLLDLALGDRVPLKFWPEWLEITWIGVWSILGAATARRLSHPGSLVGAGGALALGLQGIHYGLFMQGIWVPGMVPLMGLGTGLGGMVLLINYQNQQEQQRLTRQAQDQSASIAMLQRLLSTPEGATGGMGSTLTWGESQGLRWQGVGSQGWELGERDPEGMPLRPWPPTPDARSASQDPSQNPAAYPAAYPSEPSLGATLITDLGATPAIAPSPVPSPSPVLPTGFPGPGLGNLSPESEEMDTLTWSLHQATARSTPTPTSPSSAAPPGVLPPAVPPPVVPNLPTAAWDDANLNTSDLATAALPTEPFPLEDGPTEALVIAPSQGSLTPLPDSIPAVGAGEKASLPSAPAPAPASPGSSPRGGTGGLLAGRYQIQSILGEGGFAMTYLAKDCQRPSQPLCVIKRLCPARTDAKFLKVARRLFQSEAEILEALGHHDQIPQLLAYFEENREFYLVQALVSGHDLSQELKGDRPMATPQVADLLRGMLQVLGFIHDRHVIHRDIKPSNIIRRQDGKLVLIDFGAVKYLNPQPGNPNQEAQTIAVGTPGYAPPEQMAGHPQFNSDLYALGMLAIQAITRVPPHLLTLNPYTGDFNWRSLIDPHHPLLPVLSGLAQFNCSDRYPTAAAALKDLQRISI